MSEPRDTVLITGASSGIGEALACVCAQHDCNMILVARSIDKPLWQLTHSDSTLPIGP